MGALICLSQDITRQPKTCNRQHNKQGPPTFGGPKKRGPNNSIGLSRGGKSSKCHLVVDAQGRPLALALTEGQVHDSRPARRLINQLTGLACLLGDKAYDSGKIRRLVTAKKAEAVIPSLSTRKSPACYDKEKYKLRAIVEMTFSFFKQARRFATRYEKTARNYLSVCLICSIKSWLRF